jgi:hypothetical protein
MVPVKKSMQIDIWLRTVSIGNWVLKVILYFMVRKKWLITAQLSFNPFLFIRGLSCPSCIQASLSLSCLNLTIPGFPHNCLPVSCGDIGVLKNPRSSIGQEIRPQSAFSDFRARLPSANYSAEWSGWVWQPSADSTGFWHTTLFSRSCHIRPRKFEFKQKGRQAAISICRGLSHPTRGAALPSDNISGRFSRVEKPSDDINSRLFLMNKKGLK